MNKSDVSDGQLTILKSLFRYRYLTRSLMAVDLGVANNAVLYNKLEVLIKRGLVGKRHNKDYYLLHKPATYFLLPKAYKILASNDDIVVTDAMTKAAYKDHSRSEDFVRKFILVCESLQALAKLYPGLKQYTSRELVGYSAFPKRLPDTFLSLEADGEVKHFFLDIIPDGTPRYAIDNSVNTYHEFFLEGGWVETGSQLPALLVLGESSKTQRYVTRVIQNKCNALDMVEPSFYTGSFATLKTAAAGKDAIWTSLDEPDESLAFRQIP